jgi:hypothetical protein
MKPKARRSPLLMATAFAGLVLAGYAFLIEPNRLVAHHEKLSLPTWSGRPLRIVALSDLHCGVLFMNTEKARQVVALANAQEPDLVVLLGDYVVGSRQRTLRPEHLECVSQLGQLKSRYGTYAVLGNHDWWSDGPQLKETFAKLGIVNLENEATRVGDSFWLWGLADLWERSPDYRLPRNIPPNQPVIAIAHNPDVFPQLPADVALTVAGHTHGGQVNLPLIGRAIVPSSFGQRYAAGHIQERGHDLFVTTGIGTSILPVRFGVTPEILVLDVSGTATTLSESARSPR